MGVHYTILSIFLYVWKLFKKSWVKTETTLISSISKFVSLSAYSSRLGKGLDFLGTDFQWSVALWLVSFLPWVQCHHLQAAAPAPSGEGRGGLSEGSSYSHLREHSLIVLLERSEELSQLPLITFLVVAWSSQSLTCLWEMFVNPLGSKTSPSSALLPRSVSPDSLKHPFETSPARKPVPCCPVSVTAA